MTEFIKRIQLSVLGVWLQDFANISPKNFGHSFGSVSLQFIEQIPVFLPFTFMTMSLVPSDRGLRFVNL